MTPPFTVSFFFSLPILHHILNPSKPSQFFFFLFELIDSIFICFSFEGGEREKKKKKESLLMLAYPCLISLFFLLTNFQCYPSGSETALFGSVCDRFLWWWIGVYFIWIGFRWYDIVVSLLFLTSITQEIQIQIGIDVSFKRVVLSSRLHWCSTLLASTQKMNEVNHFRGCYRVWLE